MPRLRPALPLLLLLALPAPLTRGAEPGGPPSVALDYRSVGPAAGGRVSRVCGVPGDPLTYYAATASGGVWKSTNGGLAWKPVFDDQPTASIGSVAVAPSDPAVVYVGTGEANIRGNVSLGQGIFKSEDAGKTWKHVWKQPGQIGTVVVHPKNPDIAFAAVLGRAFAANAERGVYRTADGGKTWACVAKANADTGASDVALDPANPRVVFAGFWQTRRTAWDLISGGPGSDLRVSRDGGDSFESLKGKKNGLPPGPWGRVGVAVAPSDSARVYAIIEADKGGLYRSNDGGASWGLVNDTRPLRQRAWYYSTLTVHPANADIVYAPQVDLLKSIDGGKTFKSVPGLHHGDHHDVWIDPKCPERVINANDGGVDVSVDGGRTWHAPPLPISQFYHVHADEREPFHVMGCMQDLGSASGPSRSLSGSIQHGDWTRVGGGEAGHCVSDPADPNVVYAGEYGGILTRFDRRTGLARNVTVNQWNPSGIDPEKHRHRFQWTAPVLVSKHDRAVYHGGNVLFRTFDGGQSWEAVSPDLTRNDRRKQQWSGGPITGDNTGAETYGTIFALAESPKQAGLLWAGTDDGRVHVTTDRGKTWTEVTANVPGLPDWATVECIEASPHAADAAYLVVDNHRAGDDRPLVWKTADRGKTWTAVTAGLDPEVNANALREDPARAGLVYLATERGLQVSSDAGATWHPMQGELPTVPVADLQVRGHSLVVGTHGRSLWILDDLTPVRHWAGRGRGPATLELAPIAPAVKWQYGGGPVSSHLRAARSANPKAGVALWYCVPELADEVKTDTKADDAPAGRPVTLEIRNHRGELVATATGRQGTAAGDADDDEDDDKPPTGKFERKLSAKAGWNRFVWDVTYDGAEGIPGAPVDAGDPVQGLPCPPGAFTAKLSVGAETVERPFAVRPDPRLPAPPGITVLGHRFTLPQPATAQETLLLQVRGEITQLSRTVKAVRVLQKQLALRQELLKGAKDAEGLLKESQALGEKLAAIEGRLHNPKAKIVYDIFSARGGAMLYSQLTWLMGNVGEGDAEPTKAMREFSQELTKTLNETLADYAKLTKEEVGALNAKAKAAGVPELYLPAPAADLASRRR